MGNCRIEMLGGLQLRHGSGCASRFQTQKTASLLAYLAFHRGRDVSREVLIGLLWPDVDPASGRNRLSVALSSLRKLLDDSCGPDALVATRFSIRLDPALISTDVAEFESLIGEAAAPSAPSADLLSQAVQLYRGPLLSGYYDEWIEPEQKRLSDRFVAAAGQLIALLEADGHHDRAIELARRVTALEPFDENAHRDLMRLYAAAGRPAEAVRVFRELERRMSEDLGIAPSAETRDSLPSTAPSPPTPRQSEWERGVPARGGLPSPDSGEGLGVRAPAMRAGIIPSVRLTSRTLAGVVGLCAIIAFALFTRPGFPHPTPSGTAPASAQQDGLSPVSATSGSASTTPIAASSNPPGAAAASFGKAPAPVQASGKLLWEMHYQPEPDEQDSEPSRMAMDAAGNMYIAGFVRTTHNDVDYLTLKYSPEGNLLWKARWNGDANDCDRAYFIALDGDGNVYVTGKSYNGDREQGGTQYDIVTLKYNPNGKLVWNKSFNGAPNNDDRPLGLGLDRDGNAYVIGESRGVDKSGFYLIVKYDPSGETVWTKTCDSELIGNASATIRLEDTLVFPTGEVVVTGTIRARDEFGRDDADALTAAFDCNGNRIWCTRYVGEAHRDDRGYRIAACPDGSVIMMGTTRRPSKDNLRSDEKVVAVKYDANGREIWRSAALGGEEGAGVSCLVADDRGGAAGMALRGTTTRFLFAACLITVTPAGRSGGYFDPFNFNGHHPMASLVAAGKNGEMYLAGAFAQHPAPLRPLDDICLMKTDSHGRSIWQRIYPGPVQDELTRIMSLQSDSRGDVVIAAQTNSGHHRDITLLKYSP